MKIAKKLEQIGAVGTAIVFVLKVSYQFLNVLWLFFDQKLQKKDKICKPYLNNIWFAKALSIIIIIIILTLKKKSSLHLSTAGLLHPLCSHLLFTYIRSTSGGQGKFPDNGTSRMSVCSTTYSLHWQLTRNRKCLSCCWPNRQVQ